MRSSAVDRVDTRARYRGGARVSAEPALARSRRLDLAPFDPTCRKSRDFYSAREGKKARDGFARRGRAGTHHRNGETFTVENGLDPALPGCALTVLLEAAFTATMAAGGSFALLCAEDTGEMSCWVLCVVVVTNRNRPRHAPTKVR